MTGEKCDGRLKIVYGEVVSSSESIEDINRFSIYS